MVYQKLLEPICSYKRAFKTLKTGLQLQTAI